jgi:TolB protein
VTTPNRVDRRAAVALVVAVALAGTARAQEENPAVVVPPPSGGAYKAAIQRFADVGGGDTEKAVRLRKAIGDGLEFSSLFATISPEAFLAGDVSARLDGPGIQCPEWGQIGADALVEGELAARGSSVIVEYRAWDVARCQKLLRKKLTGGAGDLERLGKRVADEIVGAFTGKPGVASTEIAFISDRSGKKEVWIADADGGRQRQATTNKSINAFPGWAPDGNTIVYTSYREAKHPYLFVLTRGTTSPGRVFRNVTGQLFRGVFDPSGRRLAIVVSRTGDSDLYLIGRGGDGLTRLTSGNGIDVSPSFSPDGSQLAFVSDRTGSPQVYIMDAGGGGARRITFQGDYNTGAAWSPDGKWIAYETRAGGGFDIWLVDPSGETNVPLVSGPGNDEGATWAPDGRKLMFSSSRRGRRDLYAIDVDGSNQRAITNGAGNNTSPAWGPYLRELR